jgi:hypothetical protein
MPPLRFTNTPCPGLDPEAAGIIAGLFLDDATNSDDVSESVSKEDENGHSDDL